MLNLGEIGLPQVHCVSFASSGSARLMRVLFELGVAAYWMDFEGTYEATTSTLRIRQAVADRWEAPQHFRDRLERYGWKGVPVVAHLTHDIYGSCDQFPILRLRRDGRDALISAYEQVAKIFTGTFSFDVSDLMHLPLGGLNLFRLGFLEEWFLQELLYQVLAKQGLAEILAFEELRPEYATWCCQLFARLGIVKPGTSESSIAEVREAIQNALPGPAPRQDSGSKQPGDSKKWLRASYPAVLEHFNRLSALFPHVGNYSATETMEPTQYKLDDFWSAGCNLWLRRSAKRILEKFPSFDISLYVPVLSCMGGLVSISPTFKLAVLRELLAASEHAQTASSYLAEMCQHGSWAVRTHAELIMAEQQRSNSKLSKEARYYLSNSSYGCDTKVAFKSVDFSDLILNVI